MFNSTYSPGPNPDQSNNQGSSRPPFSHSHSSHGFGQQFSVAGMSNSGPAHSPSLRGGSLTGGSSLNMSGGLSDSLSQSRSQYQAGYLMSMSQNTPAAAHNQRHDEVPIVQTKAKLNSIFPSGSASDFGMGSMFETSRERQRQTLADEDAPPTASVNDIVNEVYPDSSSPSKRASQFDSSARGSLFRPAQSRAAPSTPKPAASTPPQPIYVIVFGYPPDKYSATVEYFRSLGDSTDADKHTEIMNCFRIGYNNPADAFRAVRKNGEVIGGCWMVGAKWADPAQAESLLGPALLRSAYPYSPDLTCSPDVAMSSSPPSQSPGNGFPSSTSMGPESSLALTTRGAAATPTVGTPIRLAPSTSAFRRAGDPGHGGSVAKPQATADGFAAPGGFGGFPATQPAAAGANQSPSKGVLGQVSDLIFGW
ncbi:hypothetical protein K474DRAFT_1658174 [Panus rudis PR-1116 ss-1]|nr:hypothetical protein K474DRAFT_1658174 [Panus rudis PR-1116 ss-1]